MSSERHFDCTGRDFPWVYKREFIENSRIFCDCVSPTEILRVGDFMTIRIPFTDKTLLCKIQTITSISNIPGAFLTGNKENTYYKLILTFDPYERERKQSADF